MTAISPHFHTFGFARRPKLADIGTYFAGLALFLAGTTLVLVVGVAQSLMISLKALASRD